MKVKLLNSRVDIKKPPAKALCLSRAGAVPGNDGIRTKTSNSIQPGLQVLLVCEGNGKMMQQGCDMIFHILRSTNPHTDLSGGRKGLPCGTFRAVYICLLLTASRWTGEGTIGYWGPCYSTVCHSSIWLVQHVGALDSYIDRLWRSAQACSSFAQKRNRCSSTWLPWPLGKCWARVWFIWCGERKTFLL